MAFTPEQVKALNASLDSSAVKQREQSGRTFSYVEGWFVIAEANDIFGFDGWTRETVEIRCVSERERKIGRPPNQREGWGVTYTARVRVTAGGVVRDGVGAGHGIDADLGQAHESALKEAETDAMKRALVTFGWPFGLALYDKSGEHVEKAGPVAQRTEQPPSKRQVAGSNPAGSATTGLLGALAMMKQQSTKAALLHWHKDNKAKIERLSPENQEAFYLEYDARLGALEGRPELTGLEGG